MEKEQMIKNVRAMMEYADEKMVGVVMEEREFHMEWSPFHYIKFHFFPKKGACVEYGDHGGCYNRLYKDKTEEYGGWYGSSRIRTYEESPSYVLRSDLMRTAMHQWEQIKEFIGKTIQYEKDIEDFKL